MSGKKNLVKEVYPEYVKNSQNSIGKKKIRKWKKDLNASSKMIYKMTYKDMKRCLTSLIIRKVQIECIMGYYETPISMTKIFKWEDVK